MAALRHKSVGLVDKHALQRQLRRLRRKKRKMKGKRGPAPSITHRKTYWEVVATTPDEVKSGKFQAVGDIFVFEPGKIEDILWERVRNIGLPENHEVFYHPYVGIQAAFRKLGVSLPTFKYIDKKTGTQREKQMSPGTIMNYSFTEFRPAKLDPISGSVTEPAIEYRVYPFLEIARNKWLPKFVYSSKKGYQGLFSNQRRAIQVAALFGIEVDRSLKSRSWIRSDSPNIEEEVKRNYEFTDDAYQHLRQMMISTMEAILSKGGTFTPDWKAVQQQLASIAGPHTLEIMSRLKADVQSEQQRIMREGTQFEENRPYRPLVRR